MQAVSNRRVGKTEFLLHAIDLALASHKGHNEIKMFGGQMSKGTADKPPLDGCIAG